MIWFILFQILGVVGVLGIWYLIHKARKNKHPEESFTDLLLDNVKKVLISVGFVFVLLTLCMVKPIYYSAKCSIHGTSMNAKTKYSWVMSECLMETKNGSWIPVKITRGVPDGADDHDSYSE